MNWKSPCVYVCVCVWKKEVQWRGREAKSDDEWWMQKAEKLIVTDREHLSSHTLRGQFIWYLRSQNTVRPGLNKHRPRGRHKLVLFFSSA